MVHRIDKDTTGLLVVAKTEVAMTHLAKQFFDKTSEREYISLWFGGMLKMTKAQSKEILAEIQKNRLQMHVFPKGDYGKHAVTHYKVLERFGYVTLVSCKLETGRTHQIRSAHETYWTYDFLMMNVMEENKILKGTTFTNTSNL